MTDRSINPDIGAHTRLATLSPCCFSCLSSKGMEKHRIIEDEDLGRTWGPTWCLIPIEHKSSQGLAVLQTYWMVMAEGVVQSPSLEVLQTWPANTLSNLVWPHNWPLEGDLIEAFLRFPSKPKYPRILQKCLSPGISMPSSLTASYDMAASSRCREGPPSWVTISRKVTK